MGVRDWVSQVNEMDLGSDGECCVVEVGRGPDELWCGTEDECSCQPRMRSLTRSGRLKNGNMYLLSTRELRRSHVLLDESSEQGDQSGVPAGFRARG